MEHHHHIFLGFQHLVLKCLPDNYPDMTLVVDLVRGRRALEGGLDVPFEPLIHPRAECLALDRARKEVPNSSTQ